MCIEMIVVQEAKHYGEDGKEESLHATQIRQEIQNLVALALNNDQIGVHLDIDVHNVIVILFVWPHRHRFKPKYLTIRLLFSQVVQVDREVLEP